jgi:hypothetical protein
MRILVYTNPPTTAGTPMRSARQPLFTLEAGEPSRARVQRPAA